MALKASKLFTQPDLDRIAAAVNEAERKTSGEIVPYVVDRSDEYDEAVWRSGFLGVVAASAAFLLVRTFTDVWLSLSLTTIILTTLAVGGLGLVSVHFIAGLKRFFAGKDLMMRRVSQRAAQAFISEEVFKTHDRTGILIFLSLMERRVLVVGDSGINARVAPAEWQDVVDRIVNGIRAGKPAEALIDAIQQCGVLLETRGVAIRPDDRDELRDDLRVGGD